MSCCSGRSPSSFFSKNHPSERRNRVFTGRVDWITQSSSCFRAGPAALRAFLARSLCPTSRVVAEGAVFLVSIQRPFFSNCTGLASGCVIAFLLNCASGPFWTTFRSAQTSGPGSPGSRDWFGCDRNVVRSFRFPPPLPGLKGHPFPRDASPVSSHESPFFSPFPRAEPFFGLLGPQCRHGCLFRFLFGFMGIFLLQSPFQSSRSLPDFCIVTSPKPPPVRKPHGRNTSWLSLYSSFLVFFFLVFV